MAAVISVYLSLLLTLFSGRSHAQEFNPMGYLCNNGSSYSRNSTYHSNVAALLSSLAANASRSPVGFASGTVGNSSFQQVWGLALCRGDIVDGSSCKSCLELIPSVAFGNGKCMGVKDAAIYYDGCRMSYSDSPNDVATFAPQFGRNNDVNITGDNPGRNNDVNPGRFVELAADLVGALSDYAANNSTARYAAGVMHYSGDGFTTTNRTMEHKIYGLVQCTPDQAPETCKACLDRLIRNMPTELTGTSGGQINAVPCNLRYEIYPFYESSPMVNLVAPAPSTTPPPGLNENRTRGSAKVASTIAIVLGILVAILASVLIIILCLWRKGQPKQHAEEDGEAGSLLFDLTTLRRATANFAEENKLGHGGFGAVYKGLLPDGRQIAVKRLDKDSGQGLNELRNELLLVAKLRHNNLAKLLGVCLKGQEKLLVYEYLPNRSLDTFLFEAEKRELLDWNTRYQIIYGTARGLLYLHEDSQIKIIHRDLKASNVLLDVDMNPKISDFGLARLFTGDKTTTITSQVVGTLGYMAPEYAVLGHLSVKLDVYSFGVLILEIIAGKRNTDPGFESEADESGTLLNYAWDQWSKGTPLEIMDPSLECQAAQESEVLKCIHLALLCVQENPADRPTMLDVLVMLHSHPSSFPAPSKPAFAFTYGALSSVPSNGVSGSPAGIQSAAARQSVNGMSISEFTPR